MCYNVCRLMRYVKKDERIENEVFCEHKIRCLSNKIEPEIFINYSGGYYMRRKK